MALNNESLIDNVNRTFDKIHGHHTEETEKTPEHVCCNHFSKTSAQDVDAYFPPNTSSTAVRTFLKETLAMMFNMTELDSLASVYQNLSTILNSKYLTGEVINFITGMVTNLKENKHEEEPSDEAKSDENVEILRFDEPEDEAMYRQSKFYKIFKNHFYCPSYCDLLLSKYISILPLWTCLNCKKRKSNSNSESLFNIIKSRLKESAGVIGRIPLRSSRFLRFTRQMINEWADEYWEQLPRKNCCNKKRQRSISNSPQVSKRRRIGSWTPKSSTQLSQSNNEPVSDNEPVRSSTRRTSLTTVTPKSSRPVTQLSQNHNESLTPKQGRPLRVTQLSQSSPKSSRPLRLI